MFVCRCNCAMRPGNRRRLNDKNTNDKTSIAEDRRFSNQVECNQSLLFVAVIDTWCGLGHSSADLRARQHEVHSPRADEGKVEAEHMGIPRFAAGIVYPVSHGCRAWDETHGTVRSTGARKESQISAACCLVLRQVLPGALITVWPTCSRALWCVVRGFLG
jgi:hypothetical protein